MTIVINDTRGLECRVDAVVVCSPTYTHEELVTHALAAKKAVFCEKPIAEDAGRTAKCYEAAARCGRPLFCAFNRRFDPSYEDVRRRLRAGEVGHAHIMRLTARDSPLPTLDYLRTSGGIFHDCMVHDIDLMTWMLGEYPVKVRWLLRTLSSAFLAARMHSGSFSGVLSLIEKDVDV